MFDDRTDAHAFYHVKAVARLVDLSPTTLRAWERRYGVPTPRRGSHGYRLYSEADVRTLRWLKAQLRLGMSISRAAELLAELRAAGFDPPTRRPEGRRLPVDVVQPDGDSVTVSALAAELLTAFQAVSEPAVQRCLQKAQGLYSFDEVMTGVLQPALVQIGDAWHRGDLPVAVEHFATQQVLRQLWGMVTAAGAPWQPVCVVAACAPGERHEIGLLMWVARLRWRGWDVRYLGPDLSFERLEDVLEPVRPHLLLFSATRLESLAALAALPPVLAARPGPAPRVVVGGAGALAPSAAALPAEYHRAGPDLDVAQLEALLPAQLA